VIVEEKLLGRINSISRLTLAKTGKSEKAHLCKTFTPENVQDLRYLSLRSPARCGADPFAGANAADDLLRELGISAGTSTAPNKFALPDLARAVTGQIGRPVAGLTPVGQKQRQGASDARPDPMSCPITSRCLTTACGLPYRCVAKQRFQQPEGSFTVTEIMDAVYECDIRRLYVAG